MNDARWSEVDIAIAQRDLLCHPFYRAWSEGTLSRSEIAWYAAQYYRHVKAFTGYLQDFAARCGDEKIKQAVMQNIREEQGHDRMWLDFAAGMGASAQSVEATPPVAEIEQLVDAFACDARNASVVEALAQFYAYESQVPRVAAVKNQTLRDLYDTDYKTRAYFAVHTTADVEHANVWRELIEYVAGSDENEWHKAKQAAEQAAKRLWTALDGIERERAHARVA